ncbi:MAG: hypothetical protein CFE26_02050 [Verrucomicrobiales bacterium VVV1]|nr:MAG: hypothetical protein CFE26_02050 [Verrucomicrobiales bacterium VVV1]
MEDAEPREQWVRPVGEEEPWEHPQHGEESSGRERAHAGGHRPLARGAGVAGRQEWRSEDGPLEPHRERWESAQRRQALEVRRQEEHRPPSA